MSDSNELVTAFREGHASAFEQVWSDHLPRIQRTADRTRLPHDDVEDLLQDIRIALYTSRATFAGTGDFSAWVHGVCRRRCLRWLRTRGRYQACLTAFEPFVESMTEPDSARESEAAAYDWQCERALQALDILTPRQRDVVIRRVLLGQPVAQVAAALGCATGTVKATYHTALQHLRECLQADTQTDDGS